MLAMFIAHSSQKLSLKVSLVSFYSSELGARQALAPCRALTPKVIDNVHKGRTYAERALFAAGDAALGRSPPGYFDVAVDFVKLISPDPGVWAKTADEFDPDELPKPTQYLN